MRHPAFWAWASNPSAAGRRAAESAGSGSSREPSIGTESPPHPDHLSPFTEEEGKLLGEKERSEGVRLACAAVIRGDVLIFVPEESRTGKQVVRKEASEKSISLNPAVRLFAVTLVPPTLKDPLGDYERLVAALAERFGLQRPEIDYPALLGLPGALRQGNWTVTAAIRMEREILAVFPGEVEEAYGLAIDVGSTTVAGYLCSLRPAGSSAPSHS